MKKKRDLFMGRILLPVADIGLTVARGRMSACGAYNGAANNGRFDEGLQMKNITTSLLASALLSLAACTAGAAPAANPGLLGIAELERRATGEGLTVTEIEAKDRLAEVEGYDAQSRKVKLVIDRKTGEVLERKVKQRRL
ncbi:MAG: PepSY domain-containing protein [Stenotrophomonas nitritireducens]|uniref:PepSY domain-containing protein n=1 Tax=Stenotrophomonas nitritireducens TaxID=83617 RepID=UPI001AC9E773|nr:PepSY domain-containing protein [Stenotrophomonas nitritireducens]MBN8791661.1 PepSY domain-containing protein [Stenotrophomonas nitritireducens]MBN8795599.1 PepSY domain-containing protein [Stenotrophomonas nitritireducens]